MTYRPAGSMNPHAPPSFTAARPSENRSTNSNRTATELRTLQDWVVKPQLRKVPGVAEVNTWGGFEKQYHVVVETDRLIGLMKKKAQDRTGSADNWRDLFKPLPFARGCAPQEIGAMIAFLASERCSYNSGAVVTIDAGLSARSVNF